MRVSLNLVKKYIDIPKNITPKQIAYDLTLRTVEVESVEDVSEKYHDIVVGKILEVKQHPNADKLKICITDIGEKEPVQIVCGGSNLYENEYVVVSKPGAEVIWHGEGEPVKIEKTEMRGIESYGMICGAEEVYLNDFFPPKDEREIVDLSETKCYPGQNISELIEMNDIVIEIDNKSLTNRPDLWGHYGVARELSTIYDLPLKEFKITKPQESLPKYEVEIKNPEKCYRYVAVEIDNIENKKSPLWMQTALVNCGLRPINAIVDITNYVMIATGQPLHAFDRTHVDGEKIVVRNAKKGESLVLLDKNVVELDEEDLVICDTKEPMALAGIKGGIKDSILPETTGVLLEVANFTAKTIRNSEKKFDEKTDASIRFEKNIDTQRVDQGLSLALELIKEIFPKSEIISYNDEYPTKTIRTEIDVPKKFLDIRLGKELSRETIERILTRLGYEVSYKDETYHVISPVWRSTGDVSIKDDILGDIARILSYDSFEPTPLGIKIEHAIIQNKMLLERRIKEYLSNRCGLNEIFTYSWTDEKYIDAARMDKTKMVRLATPPSPETAHLRNSLIPNMLEAISKNLRYFDSFKMYEIAQVYEKGEYHPSSKDETLPIHKKMLCGCIVEKNAKEAFLKAKGLIENMAEYCHMKELTFDKSSKPSWADINAYLDIKLNDKIIGNIGLLSVATMADSKIKHTNAAMFEINFDELVPLTSRTNEFEHLPQLPLVEKDISIIVDEKITWGDISSEIKKQIKKFDFIEEYRGNQIPEGKKSITIKLKIENDNVTMTSEEINSIIDNVVNELNKKTGAQLRDE